MGWWRKEGRDEVLEARVAEARDALSRNEPGPAWAVLAEHASQVESFKPLTQIWVDLIERKSLPPEESLKRLYEAWTERPRHLFALSELVVLSLESEGFEDFAEQRARGAELVQVLRDERVVQAAQAAGQERELRRQLACALRHAGPAFDAEVTAAYEALAAEQPEASAGWYNLGLLHKQRRRFAEGLAANQRARSLGDEGEGVLWNLGICATGAGDGEAALEAWRALGMSVERGEDGLPVMPRLGTAQVRLSSEDSGPWRDAPPEHEHVWIERLSPCHGRVLSPTLGELSADYGDLVLHDGAPIGYREVEGGRVPRFPQLGVVRRGADRCFRFAALQDAPGQIASLEEGLPEGCLVYPHTEQVDRVCRQCIRGAGRHVHARSKTRTHRQLFGKLVLPADVAPAALLLRLQELLRERPRLRLACPGLQAAAGDEVGARRDQALWEEIEGAQEEEGA